MTKRKNDLGVLWLDFINQQHVISAETMAYVAALKARIDYLELAVALARGKLKQLGKLDE